MDPEHNLFRKSSKVCEYADDAVIPAMNPNELKKTHSILQLDTGKVDLKVYVRKTTCLKNRIARNILRR